jgi:hypothetical protein
MTSRIRAVAVGLALLVGVSEAAEAQAGPLQFGPRVGYNFDLEEFSIGAHFIKPLTSAIAFYPSFDYYMVDAGTLFGINADLRYQMPAANLQWLYLGAGLGITRSSGEGIPSNTNTGLNLIGGFQPTGSSRIKPFAEARLKIGDGSTFGVFGGISIPLGN